MMLRVFMVVLYLLHCLRQRVKPWLFFQLNADYFNETKGIFSKLDIDRFIPACWRLDQFRDTGVEQPESFPVFVKPEWGQNSVGIRRAGSQVQLDQIRARRPAGNVPYLIQEAASGTREFEVYIIPGDKEDYFSVLSVTETINLSGEKLPVNSINNRETRYRDVTGELSDEHQQTVWQNLRSVGRFRMARFGIRTNSLRELAGGHFQIFEINLFLPMPLVLLSDNVSLARKISFVNNVAARLAHVTGTVAVAGPYKSVFFRKLKVHRENRAAVHKSPVREGA